MLFLAIAVRNTYAASENVSRTGKHVLTVYDDGTQKGILTEAHTLREAFKEAGIVVGANDVTEPALDDELVAATYDVNVYRARPVAVHDNKTVKKVMTPYRSAKQIAKQAGIALHDEDMVHLESSDDVVRDGAVERLIVERATPFTFVFYGEKNQDYTQATTVGEMLDEKGISLGAKDKVSPAKSTKISAGMKVEIWREGKQTVTRKEKVAFSTRQIQDADQPIGYRKVKTAGKDGEKLVTYVVMVKNGAEVSKKAVKTVVTRQSVAQVEVIGTKNSYSGSLNDWLYKLRMCETGGNYSSNTGNGFYGAYQFMPSTWNSIASMIGRSDLVGVLPSQAAPGDQDAMIIANTNMTAGLVTQNPGCYASTGISNKPPAS
ncbi:MAG TPA: ubiquitin-like domain-containing protein [Patescibacteria group bacterium]|nr:ubiquitin-like domain-containing protein [Patescibacteria group bacterium]